MTVETTVLGKVKLIPDQLWMFNQNMRKASFGDLGENDKDLTIFTVINLNLTSRSHADGLEIHLFAEVHNGSGQDLGQIFLPT